MTVIAAFELLYNRREAAAQDYELAKLGCRAARQGMDCSRAEDVGRWEAARERRDEAYERYWHYKFSD